MPGNFTHVTLVLVLLACVNVVAPEGDGAPDDETSFELFERASEAYWYIHSFYKEVLDSVMTSQLLKAAGDTLPMGIITDATEGTKAVAVKVQNIGDVIKGYAQTYYEDHLQAVADPYFEWVASTTASAKEHISSRWKSLWQ